MSVSMGGKIEIRKPIALVRIKKDLTLEERGEQYKALELSQKTFSTISDVLGDTNTLLSSIPVIGPLAALVTSGVNIVTHITSGGLDIAQTALDCADVPFDEIKEIMEKRFNAIDRKLDQNTDILEKVSRLVKKTLTTIEETRKDMNKRFDEILMSIEYAKIEPIVSQINNFISFFEIESDRIRGLKLDEYISKLKEKPGILVFLEETRTPKQDSLHDPLFSIINQKYAIPDSIDNGIAFQALYSLMYGAQTYVSVFLFLVEQYSYLANYHYERGEIDEYKDCFNKMSSIFSGFKSSLVGTNTLRKDPLIDRVIGVIKIVKNKDFIKLDNDNLFQNLHKKVEIFESIKEDIQSMETPLIMETPENYVDVSFERNIATNIGDWADGKQVRYAVQYQNGNISNFSKVSEWSDITSVKAKACPTLTFRTDQKTVIIFRKFERDLKAQLVGTLEPSQTLFFDIDRDLYNAAENPDIETGYREALKFFTNGAQLSTVFENDRVVLHAAAKSGNVGIMFHFILSPQFKGLNIRDKKGYAPIHVAAQSGKSGFVKFLLDRNAFVNVKTNRGMTPLHIAANSGFILTVQRLFGSSQINVTETDEGGFTPLHCAVKGGREVMEAFMKHGGIDVNVRSNTGLTPFHLAAITNNVAVAELLMKSNNVDVNSGDNTNMTPLHYAAMLGNTEFIIYLKTLRETNFNAVTNVNNWSPLHYAIFFKKDDAALELLKDVRVDKNLKADGNVSPLHFAVTFERKRIVSELVSGGVSFEEKTVEGYTALHLASMRKDPETVFILANGTANINAKTDKGFTPLHLATLAGRSNIALYLVKRGADYTIPDNDGYMPIHVAALNDQWEVVQAIIDGDPNTIDINNKNLDTALTLAAQKGHTVVTKLLIKNGAIVNVRNKDGFSPLLYFVKKGNLEIMKDLIDHDADIYTTDKEGTNILYLAIENNRLNVIKYIIGENKFDWNKRDNMRQEPCKNVVCEGEHCAVGCQIKFYAFCDAIGYGKLDILKYFMENLNQSECDPLNFASRYGQLSIVKYLIENRKMKVDGDEEKPHDTPLCFAAEGGYSEVVEYLVGKKANVNASCQSNKTPIDLAIQNNRLDIVKFLSENGVNLRQKNQMNYTPFKMAYVYDKFEILKYFLDEQLKNIDINERDEMGRTLLHLAVMFKQSHLVKLLVEKGIDKWIEDKNGNIAQDLAKNAEIYNYLSSNSGRFIRETQFSDKKHYVPYHDLITNSIKAKEIEHTHKKYANIESEESNINKNNAVLLNVDVIGSLLLIDMLMRYFTKQKYIGGAQSRSEADAQTAALKITQEFEELLNNFENIPEEEQINFSEVHKDIYKAIKSGKQSQIQEIMCNSIKSLSFIKPTEKEKLISEFMSNSSPLTLPGDSPSHYQLLEDGIGLVTDYCLGSERIPSLMLI